MHENGKYPPKKNNLSVLKYLKFILRRNKMKTSDIFECEINYIKSPILKEVTKEVLNASPECIQTIPASLSGKYHPTLDLVTGYTDESDNLHTGGLVNHIKAVTGIAKCLMKSNVFRDMIGLITDEEFDYLDIMNMYEDCAIVACLLHDCCKPDNISEHKTRFDHPICAAELFKKKYDELYVNNSSNSLNDWQYSFYKEQIANSIASHMGKWNTSKYMPNVILPVPCSSLENFVHMCDYLASRSFIDFNFKKYYEEQ